jgi:hypothetical protein
VAPGVVDDQRHAHWDGFQACVHLRADDVRVSAAESGGEVLDSCSRSNLKETRVSTYASRRTSTPRCSS